MVTVSRIGKRAGLHSVQETGQEKSRVYLAADLGKSSFKAVYRVHLGQIVTGNPQQISRRQGMPVDFSGTVQQVREGYRVALESYFQDYVVPHLVGAANTDIVLGGGVAHVMRQELAQYFQQQLRVENLTLNEAE